jgi:hypothetical protein
MKQDKQTECNRVTGASAEIDNRAWELAKELCAKDGVTDFSKISAKAIWIKGVLATAKER